MNDSDARLIAIATMTEMTSISEAIISLLEDLPQRFRTSRSHPREIDSTLDLQTILYRCDILSNNSLVEHLLPGTDTAFRLLAAIAQFSE